MKRSNSISDIYSEPDDCFLPKQTPFKDALASIKVTLPKEHSLYTATDLKLLEHDVYRENDILESIISTLGPSVYHEVELNLNTYKLY